MCLQTKNTGKFFLDSLNLSFWKNRAEVQGNVALFLRRNKDLRQHLETELGTFRTEDRTVTWCANPCAT